MIKHVSSDNGSELKKDFIPLLKNFVVKPKPTSIKTHHITIKASPGKLVFCRNMLLVFIIRLIGNIQWLKNRKR